MEEHTNADDDETMYAGLDTNRLDFNALKSLPELAQMKAIQSAKRQSLMLAQQQYRSINGGPSTFSNAQMNNFIKGAQFNIQVEHHVKSLKPDDNVGKRIEGDETREYVLTKIKDDDDDDNNTNGSNSSNYNNNVGTTSGIINFYNNNNNNNNNNGKEEKKKKVTLYISKKSGKKY